MNDEDHKQPKITPAQIRLLKVLPFSFQQPITTQEMPSRAGASLWSLASKKIAVWTLSSWRYNSRAWKSTSEYGDAVILHAHPGRRVEYYEAKIANAKKEAENRAKAVRGIRQSIEIAKEGLDKARKELSELELAAASCAKKGD